MAYLCERACKCAAMRKCLAALRVQLIGAEVQRCEGRAAAEALTDAPDRLCSQLVGAEAQLRGQDAIRYNMTRYARL